MDPAVQPGVTVTENVNPDGSKTVTTVTIHEDGSKTTKQRRTKILPVVQPGVTVTEKVNTDGSKTVTTVTIREDGSKTTKRRTTKIPLTMGNTCSTIQAAVTEAVDGMTNTIDNARNNNNSNNTQPPEAATKGSATPASNSKVPAATKAPAKARTKIPATKAAAKPNMRGGGAKKPGSSTPAAKKPAATVSASSSPDDIYKSADPSKFVLKEVRTGGGFSYTKIGEKEQLTNPIDQGIATFKANPSKYIAMTYKADMTGPPDRQKYTLIHRDGTERLAPSSVSSNGWMSVLLLEYQHLPPFPNNVLPAKFRDKYTDKMVHKGYKIHAKNKPLMPGRGMGCADNPLCKIIGDVDPSDIHQGQVGDCWLLSAISALAEFDGAVKKLFRKTKNLDQMPLPQANQYIVTLWDLPTWKEVDIVIDERLAVAPDGKNLLASKPSEDGELWVCYLEKAISIHCGGWDNITGGQSTHAWAIMTGCRNQYTIKKNKKTGLFACYARFDPIAGKWSPSHNNPKQGSTAIWQCDWPEVGAGGSREKECTQDELFMKMYAFDQVNYIVSAGTSGGSKKKVDEGLVGNHAYTVIEAVHNAAGTGIDLFKVRNPWGTGEIEDGEFDDDGPGWDKYPQIKRLLKPVVADDGIFWVTKQEFFKFYDTIYVSASNMTEFLEG